jgi:hypothetical protein
MFIQGSDYPRLRAGHVNGNHKGHSFAHGCSVHPGLSLCIAPGLCLLKFSIPSCLLSQPDPANFPRQTKTRQFENGLGCNSILSAVEVN